jgi:predicted esterase
VSSDRRAFLVRAAALAASAAAIRRVRFPLAHAETVDGQLGHPVEPPPQLRLEIMHFERTAMYGHPSTAIAGIPRDLAPGEKLPLIVLLPGGHHNMQAHSTGVWGWWCEYMLGDLDTAIRRGHLTEKDFQKLVRPEELDEFNRLLARTPYRGAVYLTPWVVGRQLNPQPHGTMVAGFLRELVARAREELPVLTTREATGVGGMSSGGLWAIYSGSLCSDLFSTIIATQPFTDDLVPPLRAIVNGRAQPQKLRIVSSRDDHQKKSTVELSEALKADGIEHEYMEYLGAHSAEFAAGPGGLDALLHFDRELRGELIDGTSPLPVHDGLEHQVAVREDRPRAPFDPTHPHVGHGGSTALAWTAVATVAAALGIGAARAKRGDRERSAPAPKPAMPPEAAPIHTPTPGPIVEIVVDEPDAPRDDDEELSVSIEPAQTPTPLAAKVEPAPKVPPQTPAPPVAGPVTEIEPQPMGEK